MKLAALKAFWIAILTLSALFSISVYGQDHRWGLDQRLQRAIELYNSGYYQLAADTLEDNLKGADSVPLYHHLGLSLDRLGDLNGSVKAHQQALKLAEEQLASAVSASDLSQPRIASLLQEPLELAIASGSAYVRLSGSQLTTEQQREVMERITRLESVLKASRQPGAGFLTWNEVTKKPVIQKKSEPGYTEEARKFQLEGTEVVKVVLGHDGKVKLVVPLNYLKFGMSELVVKAAKGIQFLPATKDGLPVDTVIEAEYNFRLF
jgi:tetratricopeptide (TPR) repeat protein